MKTSLRLLLLSCAFAGCTSAGTPHLTAAGHEQAALHHEQAALAFANQCNQRPMPTVCAKSRDYWVPVEERKLAAHHRHAAEKMRAEEGVATR